MNQSRCYEVDVTSATYQAIVYAPVAVGIAGNILSSIVWLRRRKTSSAVYLAALAINDLAHLFTLLTCWSDACSSSDALSTP